MQFYSILHCKSIAKCFIVPHLAINYWQDCGVKEKLAVPVIHQFYIQIFIIFSQVFTDVSTESSIYLTQKKFIFATTANMLQPRQPLLITLMVALWVYQVWPSIGYKLSSSWQNTILTNNLQSMCHYLKRCCINFLNSGPVWFYFT